MASTSLDIANAALARLGEPSITSFTDGSDAAEKVNLLYEPTVLGLLSRHYWKFAQEKSLLNTDDPGKPSQTRWKYSYKLPTLRTTRVGSPIAFYADDSDNSPKVFDYEIEDLWVHTNRTKILVEYVARKAESLWPGYFEALAIEVVAAALALPITENASKEAHHIQVAFGLPSERGRGGLFMAAIQADEAGASPASLLDDIDPMQAARFGGH